MRMIPTNYVLIVLFQVRKEMSPNYGRRCVLPIGIGAELEEVDQALSLTVRSKLDVANTNGE